MHRLKVLSNPLLIQVAASLAGAAIVIIVAFTISAVVVRSSKLAARDSSAALIAEEIEGDLVRLQTSALIRGDLLPVELPPLDLVATHDLFESVIRRSEEMLRLTGSETTLEIWGEAGEADAALDEYATTPTAANREALTFRLKAIEQVVSEASPVLAKRAGQHHEVLTSAAILARNVSSLSAGIAVVIVTLAAGFIGRRLRTSLVSVQSERDSLAELTRGMNRRNEQLGALYQIVTEITETLSLKYVVNTTIAEAQKLVAADVVALRLLHDDHLNVAGMASYLDDGREPALSSLKLGAGLVGRAAKRGRTLRIDEGAEALMSDGERIEGIQSGVIVPLIVGAKVVGTLGCWSLLPNQFSGDDERILEMMASQVATAVVAAELHEDSEQQAHHDALTGLPNRRQMTLDIDGYLGALIEQGRSFTLAMSDIDNFKRFNDEFGHRVGDVTLQKVAEVLRNSVRDVDRLYRYGGEEFLLVFADVTPADAETMAERIRRAVQQTPLTGENLEPVGPITISLGLSSYPGDSFDVEELIRRADRALYLSKEGGRNRVTISHSEEALDPAA